MKFLKLAFGFVGGNWQAIVALAAAAYIGLLHLQIAGEKLHSAKVETRLRECSAANAKLESDTRSKTAEAKAADAIKVIRVERDQSSVNQETDRDYQKQLADLRRRADALRVRPGATAGNPGRGGSPAVPSVPGAAGSADGAAAQEGLPSEDALTASEQALQLEALQNWVRGQVAVER